MTKTFFLWEPRLLTFFKTWTLSRGRAYAVFGVLMYLGGGCYRNHSIVKHSYTGKNFKWKSSRRESTSMKLNQEPPEISMNFFFFSMYRSNREIVPESEEGGKP